MALKHSSQFPSLVSVYVLWVSIWIVTRWIFQDKFWLFAILNMIAEYYFLPLPFLILIAIYCKNKQALAWLTIPTLIFLGFWGQFYLPQFPPSAAETTSQMKVMTYNALVTNRNPQQVVDIVLEELPDVIGFQELSNHNIPALDAGLSEAYPYNTFDYFSGRRSDTGLVSRFPILSVERFSFPPEERAMHAMIDWNGQRVHMFIVHFTANNLLQQSLAGAPALAIERFGNRAFQVQRIREEIAGLTEPILVLCDCNMVDTSAAYAAMGKMFTDSFKESGWGSGHTLMAHNIPFPYQRVDYIWHSQDFTSISAYVGENLSSDHYPVISILTFKNP